MTLQQACSFPTGSPVLIDGHGPVVVEEVRPGEALFVPVSMKMVPVGDAPRRERIMPSLDRVVLDRDTVALLVTTDEASWTHPGRLWVVI
ncbi:MAG: hypothetical protein GYA36_19485 [Veillonellaceae bacterium]|nr:hypothetical protein [Veillonellaceae bacterium]